MIERQEVEALVREIEEGCREHSCTPHNMSLDVEGDILLALCRAWLAVDSGQVETVRGAKFFDGYRVGKLIATAPEHMIGQRVRIVKEGE